MRHLRLLLAIGDAGQLTKVAQLLNVSQPAVSKALAEIEGGIGLKLFERTPHGLAANGFGESAIKAARDVLASLQRASEDIESQSRSVVESVAIGAMPGAALSLLAQAIALDPAVRAGLSVNVVEGTTDALMPQLLADRIQILVGAVRRQPTESVGVFPLYVETIHFAMSPQHPLARRKRLAWDELLAFPWLLPPPNHLIRTAFERALRKAGLAAPAMVVNATMTDLGMGLLTHGEAVVFMTGRQSRYLAQFGMVQPVPPSPLDSLGITMDVTAFVRAQGTPRSSIQSLLTSLKAVADGSTR